MTLSFLRVASVKCAFSFGPKGRCALGWEEPPPPKRALNQEAFWGEEGGVVVLLAGVGAAVEKGLLLLVPRVSVEAPAALVLMALRMLCV